MAILKIISHGKSHGAAKRILQYVLNPEKTEPALCHVSGDYSGEEITPRLVYENFLRVRRLFGKDSGRTYTHGTLAFAPGEITPGDAADFARELMEQLFPGHQVLTAVHTDTDHIHAHFVVEPVSCLDGKMLHISKAELKQAKELCNDLCRQRGLSVAQKGRRADGKALAPGTVSAWEKDKYRQLLRDPKAAYLGSLAAAVQEVLATCRSREAFCAAMEQIHGFVI